MTIPVVRLLPPALSTVAVKLKKKKKNAHIVLHILLFLAWQLTGNENVSVHVNQAILAGLLISS